MNKRQYKKPLPESISCYTVKDGKLDEKIWEVKRIYKPLVHYGESPLMPPIEINRQLKTIERTYNNGVQERR